MTTTKTDCVVSGRKFELAASVLQVEAIYATIRQRALQEGSPKLFTRLDQVVISAAN